MDEDPPLDDNATTVSTEHGQLSATTRGLMRSEDGGKNWRPVDGVLGTSTVSAICKHPSRKGVLYASQYGTVFASEDDGRTWKKFTSGDDSGEAFRAMLVMPGKPERLLGMTNNRGLYAMDLQ